MSARAPGGAASDEESFRSLFENNPNAMWVYDLHTLAFLAVNEAAVARYGWSAEEFASMRITDIRSPEEAERLLRELEGGRPPLQYAGSWRHRTRDGRILHVEIRSHTIDWGGREAALVVANDVTEFVRSQEALRATEARLRALSEDLERRVNERTAELEELNRRLEAEVAERARISDELRYGTTLLESQNEATIDGILVVSAEGRMVSFNSRFIEMWNIPAEVVESRSDEAALRSVLDTLKDPDEFLARVEYLYRHPDERSSEEIELRDGRIFERWSAPVRAADGTYYGRGWFFRDITERKQLHEERERVRRLRALDEMKNAFLTAVSHELRTPLTAILGFAETLAARGPASSPELLHRLVGNARKLERMLTDLLDLDRLARGILEPRRQRTDVEALVRRVVHNWEGAATRDVRVATSPVVAEVDAPKVERIVENLLSNAHRHTPASSPIWVRVTGSNEGVLLEVDDAGDGVPPELLERIFEPFEQGEHVASHSPGVGIGLALVARFAELLGGRAWAENRPEGGASFRVFLPAAPVSDEPT